MALPIMVHIDTELGILHLRQDCPSAKIPAKYRYLRQEYVTTPEQARALDQQYRACEGCKDRAKETLAIHRPSVRSRRRIQ